jgi:hypothetical protein
VNTAIRTGMLTLAGAVGVGVLALGTNGVANASDKDSAVLNKRDDHSSSWVVADDDDDDNTNTGTKTDGPSHDNTNSASRDHTNSRFTAKSRDRDMSRGDLTRDWTRDGGDKTKDKSANFTNDRTRNDTRRVWR